MSIYHAHDKFFRESFGRPEIARNYLEEYLPANLLPHLDLNQMSLLDGSFIDEDLKVHQSDLLYEVGLKKEGKPLSIFYLNTKASSTKK